MIVSVCLSNGALAMSKKKVIVKRLNSIQNLGAMDVLCTDKTGTLTLDRVILERFCDVMQKENADVLLNAYLNRPFSDRLKKRARPRRVEVPRKSMKSFRSKTTRKLMRSRLIFLAE